MWIAALFVVCMLVAGLIPIRTISAENNPGQEISCGAVLNSPADGPDDAIRRMGWMALLLLAVLSALTGGTVLAVNRWRER